jgi:hypothetical protein
MKSEKLIVAGEGMIPAENRYRLTFRDGQDKMHQCEVSASSLRAAVSGNSDPSNLVKVERIDPETGAVLGGLYNE